MGVEPFLVIGRRLRGRPAARPPAVRQVQGAVQADRGRAERGQWDFSRVSVDGLRLLPRPSAVCSAEELDIEARLAIHEVMLMTEELDKLVVCSRSRRRDPPRRSRPGNDGSTQRRTGQGCAWHHNTLGGISCRYLIKMDSVPLAVRRSCLTRQLRVNPEDCRNTSTSCSRCLLDLKGSDLHLAAGAPADGPRPRRAASHRRATAICIADKIKQLVFDILNERRSPPSSTSSNWTRRTRFRARAASA